MTSGRSFDIALTVWYLRIGTSSMSPGRILILWNQIDEDVYAHYRRDGRRSPDWDPNLHIEPWETVEETMQLIKRSIEAEGHHVAMVNVRDDFQVMLEAIKTERPDI